jgi:hypothetical protein
VTETTHRNVLARRTGLHGEALVVRTIESAFVLEYNGKSTRYASFGPARDAMDRIIDAETPRRKRPAWKAVRS